MLKCEFLCKCLCDSVLSYADNSHFELVIERLKQIAAEEKQNSSKVDSLSLTGEEEGEEETPETNVIVIAAFFLLCVFGLPCLFLLRILKNF